VKRTLENGGLIPIGVKALVWARDGGLCQECWMALTPGDDVHYDHIYPWSRGGGNDESNVQLLCQTHNLRKGDKIPAGVHLYASATRRAPLADWERELVDLIRRHPYGGIDGRGYGTYRPCGGPNSGRDEYRRRLKAAKQERLAQGNHQPMTKREMWEAGNGFVPLEACLKGYE
jgi:HNH endonuclease